MDRLQVLLDSLIVRHKDLVRSKADWKRESFILGQIVGVRTAISLMKGTESVVPSYLVSMIEEYENE